MMSKIAKNFLVIMALMFSHFFGYTQNDFTTTLIADEIPNIVALYATDLNADHHKDIFVRTYYELPSSGVNSKQLKLFWLANQNGAFSDGGTLFHINGGMGGLDFTIFNQQFADLNSDGFMDVLTSDFTKVLGVNSNGFQWHKNLGNGNFVANTIDKISFGQSFGSPIISNIDGDSTADILIYRLEKVLRYQFTGSGFDDFDLVDTLLTQTFGKLFSEDINNDGKDDLIDHSNGNLTWFENDGAGNFTATPNIVSTNLISDSLIFSDFNHDGKTDVISIENNTGISWLKNIGNGNFEIPQLIYPFLSANTFVQLNLGDINLDGANDLILNHADDGIFWVKNDGNNFFETTSFITNTTSKFMQTVDFDDDGYLDVLSATHNNEIMLYRNNLGETDTTVNILETIYGIEVSIFPNPMLQQTMLQLSKLPAFKLDILVYDPTGKIVQQILDIQEYSTILKRAALSPGMYYLHFRQSDNGRVLGSYPLMIQ
jgi:hypothetical protein